MYLLQAGSLCDWPTELTKAEDENDDEDEDEIREAGGSKQETHPVRIPYSHTSLHTVLRKCSRVLYQMLARLDRSL